jgi:hypothetical protein
MWKSLKLVVKIVFENIFLKEWNSVLFFYSFLYLFICSFSVFKKTCALRYVVAPIRGTRKSHFLNSRTLCIFCCNSHALWVFCFWFFSCFTFSEWTMTMNEFYSFGWDFIFFTSFCSFMWGCDQIGGIFNLI